MNGHRQSGGHWIVAFALATRRSGNLGSAGLLSGSGDGSTNGLRFVVHHARYPKKRGAAIRLAAPLEEERAMGESRFNSLTCAICVNLYID
jgi:hypothetical protein